MLFACTWSITCRQRYLLFSQCRIQSRRCHFWWTFVSRCLIRNVFPPWILAVSSFPNDVIYRTEYVLLKAWACCSARPITWSGSRPSVPRISRIIASFRLLSAWFRIFLQMMICLLERGHTWGTCFSWWLTIPVVLLPSFSIRTPRSSEYTRYWCVWQISCRLHHRSARRWPLLTDVDWR